jgi:hypothetical protein
LDALGFDGALFETVSEALEKGQAASEIEPQLRAAEANLDLVTEKAGGNSVTIIQFLMETVVDEYRVAITDGNVSDPGEYQDAYGFTVVALDEAAKLKNPYRDDAVQALNTLLASWPERAPIPPSNPTSINQIINLTSAVLAALPQE